MIDKLDEVLAVLAKHNILSWMFVTIAVVCFCCSSCMSSCNYYMAESDKAKYKYYTERSKAFWEHKSQSSETE